MSFSWSPSIRHNPGKYFRLVMSYYELDSCTHWPSAVVFLDSVFFCPVSCLRDKFCGSSSTWINSVEFISFPFLCLAFHCTCSLPFHPVTDCSLVPAYCISEKQYSSNGME